MLVTIETANHLQPARNYAKPIAISPKLSISICNTKDAIKNTLKCPQLCLNIFETKEHYSDSLQVLIEAFCDEPL